MEATVDLLVTTRADLAVSTVTNEAVRFEGVAVGTGTYTAQSGQKIGIARGHLPLIAERIRGVQIRDLHDERVRATVGVVRTAHVDGERVRFVGEVAILPHATIIRRFPETIAFSIGLRFPAEHLVFDEHGVAPLPIDFIVDHLAIVGQGQDPDARLTRLLNETNSQPPEETDMDQAEIDKLRQERTEARAAAEKAKAELAVAKADQEKTIDQLERAKLDLREARKGHDALHAEQGQVRTTLDAARAEADAARLELTAAKGHFANTIIKLELKADKDVDLDRRREELLDMNLGRLDRLRLELAEQATEATAAPTDAGEADAGQPATRSDSAPLTQATPRSEALDLEALSIEDTLRLGLVRGVL